MQAPSLPSWSCPADTPIQPKVLCLVEKAENVQLQHQRLADHWPAAPLPQVRDSAAAPARSRSTCAHACICACQGAGCTQLAWHSLFSSLFLARPGLNIHVRAPAVLQTWPCFLLYVLWCVVRSVAATCLADVSAVLGLPLYQGWLRWTLAACHFILLATTVLLIRKVIPVEGWAAISLLWAAAPLIPVIPALHSDVPARAAAVRVLRGVSATAATTAENLPTCLPQNVELPSLRAALRALAVACDDTLRRDQGRLTAVERNADRWEQPLRTLWRLAQVLFARPVRRSSKLPPIS